MTGPNSVKGWIIVRRQRVGSLFDNAAGSFDSLEVEQTREEAEAWRIAAESAAESAANRRLEQTLRRLGRSGA